MKLFFSFIALLIFCHTALIVQASETDLQEPLSNSIRDSVQTSVQHQITELVNSEPDFCRRMLFKSLSWQIKAKTIKRMSTFSSSGKDLSESPPEEIDRASQKAIEQTLREIISMPRRWGGNVLILGTLFTGLKGLAIVSELTKSNTVSFFLASIATIALQSFGEPITQPFIAFARKIGHQLSPQKPSEVGSSPYDHNQEHAQSWSRVNQAYDSRQQIGAYRLTSLETLMQVGLRNALDPRGSSSEAETQYQIDQLALLLYNFRDQFKDFDAHSGTPLITYQACFGNHCSVEHLKSLAMSIYRQVLAFEYQHKHPKKPVPDFEALTQIISREIQDYYREVIEVWFGPVSADDEG